MPSIRSLLLPLLLAGIEAIAAKNYTCTSFMVEVPVDNVTTIVPPFAPFADQSAVTSFANYVTLRTPPSPRLNFTQLTKIYNISAEYCTPANPGPKSSTLHLLTHGIGFDRSYWDFYAAGKPNDTQYSYINSVTAAGYSTFSYNRLGIQPSTIADPYTEIQTLVELAVLTGLTTLVRAGHIPQVPVPKKVIHVGHSWGSELSNGLAAVAPELSDGLVLTGFSHITQYQALFIAGSALHVASGNQPARFPNKTYSSGYVTWPDQWANQYLFLEYPYFDPAVLDFAEKTKYPFTIGEFLSAAALPQEAPNFKSPVLYVNGESDLIFCASNCTGLFGNDSAAIQAFNGSISVESFIQPNAGHGINLHYNATGAYNAIINWAERHGF